MPVKGCYKDLLGQKFGSLTPIEFAGVKRRNNGRSRAFWMCKCDCGEIVKVESSHLTSEHTTSCGCKSQNNFTGEANPNYLNGLSNTRLSRAYRNMKNRCTNPNVSMYKEYGKRGIQICNEWLGNNGFKNFCDWALANGYSDNLTLDRIDVNGNYEPNNCRWVNLYVQANNKRNTKLLRVNGEVDTVGNWSRRLNISYWNLLHYAKGGANYKYPNLTIEVAQ